MQNDAGTLQDNPHKIRTICSGDVPANVLEKPKEKPGALAGATGTFNIRKWLSWVDHNLKRESAASRFVQAVIALHPEDRVPFLTAILDALTPGFAAAFQVRLMQDARLLMKYLTYRQRKAIALAAYESLTEADRRSFDAHNAGVRNV